jgi:two-component system response regulator YesN
MADDLSISTWYLSRVFKAETGQNFIHYLTEYRLQQARQLMSDPAAKLHEISEQVGYAEYAHFSRVFKKYYNLTPSEYKRFAGSAERVR